MLASFADKLERATTDTVDVDGLMTKDLALAIHGDGYVLPCYAV